MKVLVTGGCGYVGSVLVPHLLDLGHVVNVLDIQWFGNQLESHPNLTIKRSDITDLHDSNVDGVDAIVHLANIANDPSVELNPELSWEVNVLATQQLATKAIEFGVKQFIFASSGSVYGIREEKEVTEDLPLIPISTYNKTKMVAERVLLSYRDKMQVHNIRPATVCGMSPRMRLDVSVNMLTYQALANGRISVFGGAQIRPNIHIKDMARTYSHFLSNPGIPSGNYNAGFENISIKNLAELIASKINTEIEILQSNDPRSYRQNSNKLLATGFEPKGSVNQAINELKEAFQNGQLVDSEKSHTVQWMRKLELAKSQ